MAVAQHIGQPRRRGIDVKSIAVSFFGGATPTDPSSPDPWDDAAIAASGPVASIAIGTVFLALTIVAAGLGERFNEAVGVLAVLVFLNMTLGFVNLVPAYPLDGGRIVRDLTWRRSGSEQVGWQAAARTGRATGWLVVLIGIVYLVVVGDATGAMISLTGWFLVLSANAVRDRVRLDGFIGDHLVREAMEEMTTTVSPSLTIDTFAAQLLDGESPVSAVPVTRGDTIVGLLGAAQVRRIRRGEWANTRVEAVMATPPKLTFLAPTDSLRQGLERIHRAGLDGLPVLEEGVLLGLLTRRGSARFVRERAAPRPAAKPAEGPPEGPSDPAA